MIKFWSDIDRLYALAGIGVNYVAVYECCRLNILDSSLPKIRKNFSVDEEYRCMKLNDVRINIEFLTQGYKI